MCVCVCVCVRVRQLFFLAVSFIRPLTDRHTVCLTHNHTCPCTILLCADSALRADYLNGTAYVLGTSQPLTAPNGDFVVVSEPLRPDLVYYFNVKVCTTVLREREFLREREREREREGGGGGRQRKKGKEARKQGQYE